MLFTAQVMASTPAQKDSTVINTLFSQTKPQCIGRYVIDVPGSFNNQLHDMVFIDDFKIESKPLYPPAFKQRVKLREQALNDAINTPGNNSENAPFIKQIIRLQNDKGVIYDRNNSGSADSFRHLEAHVYINGIAFIITTKILDLSAIKYSDEKKSYLNAGFSEVETNTKPARLAALQSLISRLSGRKDEEIPTGKGVCIPNGFIRDDYNFMLYANERDATPDKPNLNIGLGSEYKKTRYSEAQMIEIWDRLVNSLRYK